VLNLLGPLKVTFDCVVLLVEIKDYFTDNREDDFEEMKKLKILLRR